MTWPRRSSNRSKADSSRSKPKKIRNRSSSIRKTLPPKPRSCRKTTASLRYSDWIKICSLIGPLKFAVNHEIFLAQFSSGAMLLLEYVHRRKDFTREHETTVDYIYRRCGFASFDRERRG